jgi:O-antigen/teichoic acid export membrane protein
LGQQGSALSDNSAKIGGAPGRGAQPASFPVNVGANPMLVRVFKNFASQLFNLSVTFGDRFVLTAILLRAWPTDIYADWTTILTSVGLLGVADLGLVTWLSNRLHKAFALGEETTFQRTLGVGLFAYAGVGIVMLFALLGLATIAASGFYPILHGLARADAILLIVLLGLAQTLLTTRSAISQVYRGRDQFARGMIIESLSALCIIGSLIIGGASGLGPVGLAFVYLGAQLVFGWGLLLVDLRRFPSLDLRPIFPLASEAREVALAMRWYSLGTALPILWLQTPILILGSLGLNGAALVAFVLHRTLVNFCRTFTVMISTSAGVELARYVHAGEHAEIQRRLKIVGAACGAVSGTIIAGLLTFGRPLIHVWSSGAISLDAATMLWLLMPAFVLVPAFPLVYLAHLSDLPKPLAISQVVQVLVGAALAVLLVREYGSSGVAFALAVGEIIAIGTLLPVALSRRLGNRLWGHAIRSLATAAAALGAAILIGRLVVALVPIEGVMSLLLAGLAWGILTLPLLAYLATSSTQRQTALLQVRLALASVKNKPGAA